MRTNAKIAKKPARKFGQTTKRLLACLAILLIPFATRAQVGIIDHKWTFNVGRGSYGVVQITFPGPHNTYTYFFFGRTKYQVHAHIATLTTAALVTIALAVLAFAWFTSPSRKSHEPKE